MSEWLQPDGRKAAELLGPIEYDGEGSFNRVYLAHTDEWERQMDIGGAMELIDILPNTEGQMCQNDHARRRLAENNIYVRPDGEGQWEICWLHDGGEYLWDGDKFTDSGEYKDYTTYETALIAAVMAVFGKEKT